MTAVALSGSSHGGQRAVGSRQETAMLSRLHKAHCHLAGVTSMHEGGRYRVDVLDQLSVVTAAVDGVAVLILTDHINASVLAAIESGDSDEQVGELVTAVRRHVRSR